MFIIVYKIPCIPRKISTNSAHRDFHWNSRDSRRKYLEYTVFSFAKSIEIQIIKCNECVSSRFLLQL